LYANSRPKQWCLYSWLFIYLVDTCTVQTSHQLQVCIILSHNWVLLQTGFGLVTWSVEHLYTELRTTSNATANFHNSQIITAPAKTFSSVLCLHWPFSGNGFSQWRFFSFMHSNPFFTVSHAEFNSTDYWLGAPTVFKINPRHRPCRRHRSISYNVSAVMYSCHAATSCVPPFIKNLLHQQWM
jgi:hypothetical protein